jgi:heme-degrading monooxygenase HmoA
MIIREWRGRALRAREGAYVDHFNNSVLPQLKNIPGFIGANLMSRPKGDLIEFVVLTRWVSLDAVRSFAGPRPERAVVEPAAAAALTDFDPTVQHYEILADVSI